MIVGVESWPHLGPWALDGCHFWVGGLGLGRGRVIQGPGHSMVPNSGS